MEWNFIFTNLLPGIIAIGGIFALVTKPLNKLKDEVVALKMEIKEVRYTSVSREDCADCKRNIYGRMGGRRKDDI